MLALRTYMEQISGKETEHTPNVDITVPELWRRKGRIT